MNTISTEKYTIHIGDNSLFELNKFLSENKHSSVFILVDENTKKRCLPLLKKSFLVPFSLSVIQIKSGEKNKNIRTCEKIWKELSKHNADRKSLLINLGGGVITDMGGFAASTYKRGIDFINIPTTLLAQVDASVGGKTGIDFSGIKNQIGTFSFPKAVFINPGFLKTLNKRELLSGFAEVIKHGLIADRNYWKEIQASSPALIQGEKGGGDDAYDKIIFRSVQIKNDIVGKDLYESGPRKMLNFGHTIGHAVESASLKTKQKLLHGEAIAIGMICEAYLSRKYCGLPSEDLNSIAEFITRIFNFKPIKFSVKKLMDLMKQDKKNKNSEINFTLLSTIGKAEINNSCSEDIIEESMNFFNEVSTKLIYE